MKLMNEVRAGAGIHRSGWPMIVSELDLLDNGRGLPLDDFADGSYSYRPIQHRREFRWCGIFHHPVRVTSPIKSDMVAHLRNAERHPCWTAPVKAVSLTEEGRKCLSQWLKIPVISLKHGIDRHYPQWRASNNKKIVQIGSTLRNTRAIFDFDAPGWSRYYLRSTSAWSIARDRELQASGAGVTDLQRLPDRNYDQLLSSCIAFSEYFAASASNLILECMVRGTPLLTNRLPAIEEYLGADYPLYLDCFALTPSRLQDTHEYLLDRSRILPTTKEFAESVCNFVDDG